MHRLAAIAFCFVLTGCVAPGGEGMTSTYIDAQAAGGVRDRREALRTVTVVSAPPSGMTEMGVIATRRCHRYFTETPPTAEAMLPDLRVIAFGEGADAIRPLGVERKNGLAANCWYVLEASAMMYRR